MTYFSAIEITEWQQFREITIEFDRRVTIITGANASGKTTILNLLGRHSGWNVQSLAVPQRSRLESAIRFVNRIFRGEAQTAPEIGRLLYSDGQTAHLRLPQSAGANYQVEIQNQREVPCFFVPSHRSVYRYEPVSSIPVGQTDRSQAFQRVWQTGHTRYFGGHDRSATYHMKEMLVSWSIFGRGNQDMAPNLELLQLYEGFQEVLRKLLPSTLGFRKFSIRNMEIVLECDSAEFMLDAASGGLSALIDLAWQIFMFRPNKTTGFTVIIDEVENHLHPTMQRRVLDDLLKAFPEVRFIVSTHSPLVVNSVEDAAVFALRYDSDKTVRSQHLDMIRKAQSAIQILDEVLGVTSTIPLWAEDKLKSLVSQFNERPISEQSFVTLRTAMADVGLSDFMPQALGRILETRDR